MSLSSPPHGQCDSLQYFTVQGRQQGWIESLAEITWSSKYNFCRWNLHLLYRSKRRDRILHSNLSISIWGVHLEQFTQFRGVWSYHQLWRDLLNHHTHEFAWVPCHADTRRWIVSVLVSTYDYTCPWFSPNFMTHLSSINFNKLLHQIGTYNPISAIKLLTNQVILIIQYLNQTLSLKSSGFQWPPHLYIPGSQRKNPNLKKPLPRTQRVASVQGTWLSPVACLLLTELRDATNCSHHDLWHLLNGRGSWTCQRNVNSMGT